MEENQVVEEPRAAVSGVKAAEKKEAEVAFQAEVAAKMIKVAV